MTNSSLATNKSALTAYPRLRCVHFINKFVAIFGSSSHSRDSSNKSKCRAVLNIYTEFVLLKYYFFWITQCMNSKMIFLKIDYLAFIWQPSSGLPTTVVSQHKIGYIIRLYSHDIIKIEWVNHC